MRDPDRYCVDVGDHPGPEPAELYGDHLTRALIELERDDPEPPPSQAEWQ